MKRLKTDVVVIGGGTTGIGVLRDCAMRGYKTILLDRADLAQGTSGRFHGLLHSGGRYVVTDPESGRECAAENAIIGRIQPEAVERTGGLFVVTPKDDPAFGDKFLAGAAKAAMPVEEIATSAALAREPRLNPGIKRAFLVEDGTVDGWQIAWSAAESAKQYGGQALPYHKVTQVHHLNGAVTGVTATDLKRGETVEIDCSFILNCAGPWAGQVTEMAGLPPVSVIPGRGIMIAMNHRLVNTVINRCIPPADGDIIVPLHTVCIIGTTDHPVTDPDHLQVPANEVQQMFDSGEELLPGFRSARALHTWAGARPLIKDDRVATSDTRHMSRGMAVIDHSTRDGVSGMLTIGGGKLTTYRLMAEHIVDAMEDQLGSHHPCRTADEICPGNQAGHNYLITHRLKDREADRLESPIICECELMNRQMALDLFKSNPLASFDDLRRQLRLGMGPCQGGFCSARLAGLACQEQVMDAGRATGLLKLFLEHRWIGLWPILHGAGVRQAALDAWMLQGTLDVAHIPSPARVEPDPISDAPIDETWQSSGQKENQ
ncbi:MAG: anaerobic glycerol-3-phosphate dehydrogenase subunit A [Propionibacteriaceae bacterium]|jgi:glycerol-3-phosphate dehydrogenase|nr:anaerobic glycerol-3-phosphate dehydrogenase subunit A [Propionibacteriaceae bacterium]